MLELIIRDNFWPRQMYFCVNVCVCEKVFCVFVCTCECLYPYVCVYTFGVFGFPLFPFF